MQVFVIGMHRSGTSMVSRLLNMMGLYFGAEGSSTGANIENPKGFWERRDVRKLNDYILQSNGFDWNFIHSFNSVEDFDEVTRIEFEKNARNLIFNLDAFRPWFLKEPRFCLTFPLWRKYLELPIIIYIYRNPYEVAKSLHERNEFPIDYGVAMWEKYNSFALQNIKSLPTYGISHENLLKNPSVVINDLYDFLKNEGVEGIRTPTKKEISSFIEEKLHRQKAGKDYSKFLTKPQQQLWEKIQKINGKFVPFTHKLSAKSKKSLEKFEESMKQTKELENEIKSVKKSIENISIDFDQKLKVLLETSEGDFQKILSFVETKDKENSTYVNEFKNFKENIFNDLENALNDLKKENSSRLEAFNEKFHDSEKVLNEFREQIFKVEKEKAVLLSSIEFNKEKVSHLNNLLEENKIEREKLTKGLDDKVRQLLEIQRSIGLLDKLREENEELKYFLKEVETASDQLKEDKIKSEVRLEAELEKSKYLQEDIRRLNNIKEKLEQEKTQFLVENENIKSELEKLRVNKEEFQLEIRELKAQVEKAELELQKVNAENNDLIEKNNTLEGLWDQENTQLQNQVILLNEEKDKLLNNIEELENFNKEFQQQIASFKDEINNLSIELQKAQGEKELLQNNYDILLDNYEEINNLYTNLSTEQYYAQDEINQHLNEKDELKYDLEKISIEVKKLKSRNNYLESELRKRDELISLKDKVIIEKEERIIHYWNTVQEMRLSKRIKKWINFENLLPSKKTDKVSEISEFKTPEELQPISVKDKETGKPSKETSDLINRNGASSLEEEIALAPERVTLNNISNSEITVVAWDMSHNPAGRAFLFADFLKTGDNSTILVGPIFEKYGKELWEPLKQYPIDTDFFHSDNFPVFLHQVKKYTQTTGKANIVVICKPRIPSVLLGLILSKLHGAKYILDIDDHELSFFKEKTPISLDEIEKFEEEQLKEPFGEAWTRLCENLAETFPLRVTSNTALQEKFGGEIIPHVRDENLFNPTLFDRAEVRNKYGYKDSDKVILFLGTPRKHKGFVQIAEALKEIENPDYKLCVIGSSSDDALVKELTKKFVDFVSVYPSTSFNDLPQILAIADLICLLQDPSSSITEFQMPAKFTDALSMSIPILATPVKPLIPLGEQGLLELLNSGETVATKIDHIFTNYEFYKEKAVKNRNEFFLKTHSYSFAKKKIDSMLGENKISFQNKVLDDFISKLNKKYYKNGRVNNIDWDNINIVFFWKQNDSGLYGRRQDMIIKYLEQLPNVKKIIHFDAPIGHLDLVAKNDSSDRAKYYQNKFIFDNTIARIKNGKGSDKLSQYTFVYNQKPNAKINQSHLKLLEIDKLPNKEEYMNFILSKLKDNEISDENSVFWFCPAILDFNDIISVFSPAYIVADFIDDQRKWPLTEKTYNLIDSNYKDFVDLGDLILCNSEEVQKSISDLGKTPAVISNGLEDFRKEMNEWTMPEELARMEGPIIGYVGNLDPGRLDLNIIEEIAIRKPNYNIVLIGSSHMGADKLIELNKYDNIHLLGVIPYEESVKYIKYFDVGIIPHYDNEMTQSMNPLKLYVYHALGIKIVTTKLKGLDLSNHSNVFVADTKDQFINLINECLKPKGKKHKKKAPHQLRKKDGWDFKVEQILVNMKEKIG